jgi:hypothetical protein
MPLCVLFPRHYTKYNRFVHVLHVLSDGVRRIPFHLVVGQRLVKWYDMVLVY